jgi:hypothetical protein
MTEAYARGGYARGGQEETTTGSVMLMVASLLAAVLVIAGLAYAAGTGGRHKAALAAAGCEPNLSPSGLQCTTVQMLTGQYTAMMTPAMQQLNGDSVAYTATERLNLAAAQAALTAAVAAEHALDTRLAGFPFPPAVVPTAKALVQAYQALATLISEQARSSSLTQLRSFNPRVEAASAAVQTEMNLTRKALDTPPTANQEP